MLSQAGVILDKGILHRVLLDSQQLNRQLFDAPNAVNTP